MPAELNYDRFRRLSKEGLWVLFGQAMTMVGSIFGVRLLTELLTPAAYGELALGLTVAMLVNQTVLGPLGSGASRFFTPAQECSDVGGFLRAVRRSTLLATGIIAIMSALLTLGLLLTRHTGWMAIAVTSFACATLGGYNGILNGIQNAARQRSIVALHQAMDSWARTLIAAGLALVWARTSEVVMVGYSLATGLVLASQYAFFRKVIRANQSWLDEKRWQNQIFAYSWPMAVTGIASWGHLASQRWALELFGRTEDVGHFSVVFQIGYTPFSLAGSLIMTILAPVIFSRAGDGSDKQRFQKLTREIMIFCGAALLLVLLCASLSAACHGFIFRLLAAKQYRPYSHYLPFAMFAGGIMQVSYFLSGIVLASTRTRILLPMNTLGNLLIIATNFLFAYLFGIGGLFAAIAIGSVIHLAWTLVNVRALSRHA
jgi:O-antigen/teichoic acid export membrane protein